MQPGPRREVRGVDLRREPRTPAGAAVAAAARAGRRPAGNHGGLEGEEGISGIFVRKNWQQILLEGVATRRRKTLKVDESRNTRSPE